MDKAAASTARTDRINMLESLLTASSSTLVAMSVQLSEAEERERTCNGRARWQNLRSMGDAKTLLHLMFNVASLSRYVNNAVSSNGVYFCKLEFLTFLMNLSSGHRCCILTRPGPLLHQVSIARHRRRGQGTQGQACRVRRCLETK
jgi:hypothetical protein